jgi:serine protease Do
MFKAFIVAIALTLFCAGCVKPDGKLASSTVYVDLGIGHGSGVHIGNGMILTAWHVVDDEDKISVTDSNGKSHATEVMWSNKPYDVALLRVNDFKTLKARALSCRYLDQGEQLSFEGSPINFNLVKTWGKVSKSQIAAIFDWKEAYLIDGTLAPGMSGGPALDQRDNVVGINVGLMNNLNFVTIVPSRTVCALLAR